MTMSFELYVDIDQDFNRFLKSRTWDYIKENWKYVKHLYQNQSYPVMLYYRRSSSGNVHLMLKSDYQPSVIEQFQIRALLHDDPWRIGIDLRRLAIQGESEINRIFNMKVKNGVVYKVGPWIDISDRVEGF
jgi:hypothetical protein